MLLILVWWFFIYCSKGQRYMNTTLRIFAIVFLVPLLVHSQPDLSWKKKTAIKYIDQRKPALIEWSNVIWQHAEPSLQEIRSSALIIDVLKKEGFTVQEKVSGFETVFIATYGDQKPIIGLFGEYDADAGASNKTVPYKGPLVEGGYGHGGHHNVLGIGSLGAALAIKELISKRKLKCTIRYYGTTAEGTIGSKSYLARDGYFNDLDLSLYWHPSPVTAASTGKWDAMIDAEIRITAPRHDVARQQSKATTLDALEELVAHLQSLRKLTTPAIKLNYLINTKEENLNYTADTTQIDLRIQCAYQRDADSLFARLKYVIQHAREKTGVAISTFVTRAKHQFLPSVSGTRLVHKNITLLGPISYNDAEQQFVKAMQKTLNIKETGIEDRVRPFIDTSEKPETYGYSSDIGDASWIAPEIYFTTQTLPMVQMHQWPGTAFSAHSIAHKGMIYAAKLLSMTIIDFVEREDIQHTLRNEFVQKTAGYRYRSMVPPLKK